jgi:hypothetical protein
MPKAKERKKAERKPPATGPITIVLLSSLTELGVVRAVAKNGKTTDRGYFARDFGTEAKATAFINRGFVPDGWRGHVKVIDRTERKIKLKDGVNTGQLSFLR